VIDPQPNPPGDARLAARILAAFLTRFAKHLALIGILLIIGRATGRFTASQLQIFACVGAAAALHCAGFVLKRRILAAAALPRFAK
jgi:hypothetical protein